MKIGRDSINQHREGSPPLDFARLPQSQDAFAPSLALFACRSEASLAPQPSEAQHPLGMVVRRIDASPLEKEPQALHLKLQPTDQLASQVLSVAGDRDETPEVIARRRWRR